MNLQIFVLGHELIASLEEEVYTLFDPLNNIKMSGKNLPDLVQNYKIYIQQFINQ